MSRTMVEDYYISHGGAVPVKWTAPEVCVVIIKIHMITPLLLLTLLTLRKASKLIQGNSMVSGNFNYKFVLYSMPLRLLQVP